MRDLVIDLTWRFHFFLSSRVAEVDESIAAFEPSWILDGLVTICIQRFHKHAILQSCNADISVSVQKPTTMGATVPIRNSPVRTLVASTGHLSPRQVNCVGTTCA